MSKKAQEMVGKKFGMLTVLSVAEPRRLPSGQTQQMLSCICDCGEITTVSYSHLKYGGVLSCGCLKHRSKYENLIGQRFNRLTVIRHLGRISVGTAEQYSQLWECQCDCGNVCNVDSRSLKSGNTKSCGCIQGEALRQKHLNEYDLTGSYGVGFFNNGGHFLFDLEDYPLISAYTWHLSDTGYVVTTYKGKSIRMHRLLLGLEDFSTEKEVDHKNHNTCDNRKFNLRVCTHKENLRNRAEQSNNTSGHIGVGLVQDQNKYRAYLGLNGSQINLGTYDTYDAAVKAREEGEHKYFKEYAFKREDD